MAVKVEIFHRSKDPQSLGLPYAEPLDLLVPRCRPDLRVDMDRFPWLDDNMYGEATVLFGAVCIKCPPRNGFQGTHTHRH